MSNLYTAETVISERDERERVMLGERRPQGRSPTIAVSSTAAFSVDGRCVSRFTSTPITVFAQSVGCSGSSSPRGRSVAVLDH